MTDAPMTSHQLLDGWSKQMEQLEERIARDTEQHRKADVTLSVTDSDGKALAGASVDVELTNHAVSFGANSFMLGGYKDDAKNQNWHDRYTQLFNHTVVGFFWSSYEPTPGQLRFASDSEPKYRRPPVDTVLDWCEANGIKPKGHNLFWATNPNLLPDWLPDDPEQWRPLIRKRFEQIAARYDGVIDVWDVVNEVCCRNPQKRCPRDYVQWCYQQADELFPQSRLFVNETTGHTFHGFAYEDSWYHLLIERLQAAGRRVDGIGMQHHLFGTQDHYASSLTKGGLSPRWEMQVMDHYARFGLPLHISEITVGSAGSYENTEQIQERLVRDYYRLWFSCPAVEAIVWWNMVDGDAYEDESKHLGGLIREDHSPKPAYDALDQLINHDWKTKTTLTTDGAGRATFRGFHGTYDVRIDGETHRADVAGQRCEIEVTA